MSALVIRCALATTAFVAYWIAWLYDYGLERFEIAPFGAAPYYALVMALPCTVVGVLIGRWWAPAITLAFVPVSLAIPMRCVRESSDVISCFDFAFEDVWVLMAWTCPWLLLGGLIVTLGRQSRARLV